MPNKPSQREQIRYGTPIRTAVDPKAFAVLLEEAKRTKRSVGHVAGVILTAESGRVKPAVQDALEAEAARTGLSVGDLKATLLQYWYEDVWLPTQRANKKAG